MTRQRLTKSLPDLGCTSPLGQRKNAKDMYFTVEYALLPNCLKGTVIRNRLDSKSSYLGNVWSNVSWAYVGLLMLKLPLGKDNVTTVL